MTSLRFGTAVHTMVLLAHLGADSPARAEASNQLAQSIGANPVVVRRVMAALADAGLLHTKQGAAGGAWLARPPEQIRMSEIYAAVDEAPAHASRAAGNKDCPIGRAAPSIICGLIRAMDEAALGPLTQLTLSDVVKQVETAAA